MFQDVEALTGDLTDISFISSLDQTRVKSGFLNHHFIGYGLNHHKKVILVGLDQTFGHYHSVSLKLGRNLVKLKEENRLCFFDALKMLLPSVLGTENIFRAEFGLKQFYEEISKLIEPNSILILDDVSTLSNLGFTDRDLMVLISKLRDDLIEQNGQLVCTLSSPIMDPFTCYITRMSLINFHLQDLETGKSRDVSGHLSVTHRRKTGDVSLREFQFRLEDKNVKVFPPGTSGAVL